VDIALVLPLDSPDYARAAAAVREGFLAAAGAANAADRCRVIAHDDKGVLGAFEAAKALGASVVVGPLVRDDLRRLAESPHTLPLTLALNQLDDAAALPPQVYTLALSVENDARALARRMRDGGATTVVVIGNDSPISRRFAAAFHGEWLLAGGGPTESVRFDARPDGLTALRATMAKSNASAAVLALDGPDAAVARSFVLRVPVYAISLINQPHESAAKADLEGVRFIDVPWLVTPDLPTLAKLPRRDTGNVLLDRLYALGLDAFQVARAFVRGVPDRLEIAGATGQLTLAEGRHFTRDGVLAEFRRGQVVPVDAPR
jgi:outer membrane PBP1 activator LpoA protein